MEPASGCGYANAYLRLAWPCKPLWNVSPYGKQMRPTSRTAVGSLSVALLVLVAVPTEAAAASVTDDLIRNLNRQLLYMAVPIAVLVEVILLYTVWRFHGNDDPEPTRENRQLEITWTVATALVLLFVGTASFHVLANPMVSSTPDTAHGDYEPGETPPDAVEAHVVAEQFEYGFEYPDENVTTDDELVLPTNRTVYVYVTSRDVIHSFHVPDLGLKQDAFPGEYHQVRTRFDEEGTYRLYCAELCGDGHAEMTSTVRVVDEESYESWLETADEEGASTNGTAGDDGASTNDSAAGDA